MLDKINIDELKEVAIEAGKEIMNIYATDFEVTTKEDNSPLTLADQRSNEIILDFLKEKYPEIPYISEEIKAMPYEDRKDWEYAWLIDPLDGTKEFMKKNGEFTVNIALIHNGKPVLGVVHVPTKNLTYWGVSGKGAFVENSDKSSVPLKVADFSMTNEGLTLVCSRSHLSPEVEEYVSKFKDPQTISMGSSLKFMLLAEQKAHIYPRLAPTMEWDTAAAHAVLIEAGGKVLKADDNTELTYNKENLLNPHFIAYGNAAI